MKANDYPITIKELGGAFGFSATVFGILVSTTLPMLWVSTVSGILFVLFIIIALQVRILTTSNQRFSFVKGQEGKEIEASINAATKSIVTTAFSADKPTEKYVNNLLAKLDKGISVTRLISKENKDNPDYRWAEAFYQKPHFIEKVVDGFSFPFDVYIFDGKTTRIYFPISQEHNHFKDGVKFECEELAAKFKVALDKVILQGCVS